MAVTFLIKDKSKAKCQIQIYISFHGIPYKRNTGESIPLKYWNQEKKRVKESRDFIDGNMVNEVLERYETAAKKTITHFKQYYNPPSKDQFWRYFDSIFYKQHDISSNINFCDYLVRYIDRYKEIKSTSSKKKYRTTLNKLRDYENERGVKLFFQDIDIEFYNKFKKWFFDKGFSTNYFGNTIKVVKQVYKEARIVDKLHNGDDIEHRDFVGTRVETGSIYLNQDELQRIFELQIDQDLFKNHPDYQHLDMEQIRKKIASFKIVRDRFLIGAYTGLRVSDFARLRDVNIGDKFITIKAQKTETDAIVPIHPVIREIIANGFDPAETVSSQKINKHIKEIANLAGITDQVVIYQHVAGKPIEKVFRKYELVCTHTARRSFATNAHKAGMPNISIMKITGHKREADFLRYIKVTAEENAEILSRHSFFN